MTKQRLNVLMAMSIALTMTALGLAGCRQDDAGVAPTPAALATPQKQMIPVVGGGEPSPVSPLPTPGANNSPLAP